MDKQPDSMATIQMKPEYAASEVYSTTSEAPPAYIKQHSNSVKIAKIIALTVIASSFIIGSFILASAYLQARSSCDQMQTFDSILEKELMLEALQQELPKAEALMQEKEENQDINDLQKLETDSIDKKSNEQPIIKDVTPTNAENTDSSFSDNNEDTDDSAARVHIRLPLELDISDLANALLENNQKSRMNCVIERRHAEEFVDAPAKTMQLPFGLNITTEQKKQRVTGERMAIFCESGTDDKNQMDQAETIPQFMMPVQRYPIPYGATPQHNPMTHMPQQMAPPPPPPPQHQQPQMMFQSNNNNNDESPAIQFPGHFMIRQMALPLSQIQQHLQPQQRSMLPPPQMSMRPPMVHQMNMQPPPQQQQPPVPDQIMQAPRPEQPEIRIQLQRIPFPINSNELSDTPVQIQLQEIPINQMRFPQPQQQQQQQQQEPVQVQRIPLAVALQRAGITPEDLQNIQRMAEARIQQELRHLAEEELSNSSSDSNSSGSSSSDSSEDEDSQSIDDSQQQQQQQDDKIMQIGRSAFGRSLVTPVRIPVNLMQQITQEQEEVLPQDRPHFVQPRSVRSAEDVLKGEKRVKRCACNCDC